MIKILLKLNIIWKHENLMTDKLEDKDVATAITLKLNFRVQLRWLRMGSSGKFL